MLRPRSVCRKYAFFYFGILKGSDEIGSSSTVLASEYDVSSDDGEKQKLRTWTSDE